MILSDVLPSYYEVNQVSTALRGKDVLIWGTGEVAHKYYEKLVRHGIVGEGGLFRLIGFYTSNPRGRTHCFDQRILSREELEELSRDTPVIVAVKDWGYFQEIIFELRRLGFANTVGLYDKYLYLADFFDTEKQTLLLKECRQEIETVYQLLEDEESRRIFRNVLEYRLTNNISLLREIWEKGHSQYFPGPDIYSPGECEVFIDGGCSNAATIGVFKEWTQDRYEKVYAFEPVHMDWIFSKENIYYFKYRAEVSEAGLYNKNGNVSMVGNGIVEEGEESIRVVTLDSFMKDKPEKVSLLKLDVEGSELPALEGAMEIIERDHPKLAICVYHKDDDLWKIPLWIYERFPGYKFYMRHYTPTNLETVLYARYDG